MPSMIKITKELFCKILSSELNFELKEIDGLGTTVVMPAGDALSYSIITSHGYLDTTEPNNLFQLTRDSFRVFNQVEQLELQEGLFSLDKFGFSRTVKRVVVKKPYILKGKKFLLPVSYTKMKEFYSFVEEIAKKIKRKKLNINDFIIAPISNKNSNLESFFEYVVSTHYNHKGFLTDTQIPFFYGTGTPDVAAYKIKNIMRILRDNEFLEDGGSIFGLMYISSFGFCQKKKIQDNKENESIVFDVKTLQTSAPQIEKYTKTKLFNYAYEIIPVTASCGKFSGTISINQEDGRLVFFKNNNQISFDEKERERYFQWMKIYIKMYLLANLDTKQLKNVMERKGYTSNNSELIKFVQEIDFEEIVFLVKELIPKSN